MAQKSNAAIKTNKGGEPDMLTYLMNSLGAMLGGTSYGPSQAQSYAPAPSYGGMQITNPNQRLVNDINQYMMAQVPDRNPAFASTPEQDALGSILSMAITPDTSAPSQAPTTQQDEQPTLKAPVSSRKPKPKKKRTS